MRRSLVLGLLAVSLVACGSRVDPQAASSAQNVASPSSSTPTSRVGPPSTTSAGPSSSAPAAGGPTATVAPTTATVGNDPSFDQASFCAAISAAPLADITGFAVFERAKADAIDRQFADLDRLAPSYLREATADLKKPVDELVKKVDAGEISTQPQLQDWIMANDAQTLTNWVSGQRQVLAWHDANCT